MAVFFAGVGVIATWWRDALIRIAVPGPLRRPGHECLHHRLRRLDPIGNGLTDGVGGLWITPRPSS